LFADIRVMLTTPTSASCRRVPLRRSPFSSKISARFVDFGTLVTAGSGSTGTALFSIVQSDPLRVYVFAPQENAPSIHEGLAAKILLDEFPGQEFDGMVTRTAGALDPQSRTMQVEVQVPNHDGELYAGMYGQVKFLLVDENAPIVVPANNFFVPNRRTPGGDDWKRGSHPLAKYSSRTRFWRSNRGTRWPEGKYKRGYESN
jgi:multidrug efflux pump subunit AcrA (membrane-fusion protein)